MGRRPLGARVRVGWCGGGPSVEEGRRGWACATEGKRAGVGRAEPCSGQREGREEGEGEKEKREKEKGEKKRKKGKRNGEKEKRKWEKGKKREEKGGGECAPAATAAAVDHARRRSRVRGPGEVGHARCLRPSGAWVHAAGRRGRREIRGDNRDRR